MFYVTLLLSDFIGNFLQSCYKQRWILFRRVNATTVYTNRVNGGFRFVLLFFYFLLPCLINASVSVCAQFSLFPPSTKWWPLKCVFTQIDCPNNTETHTHMGDACLLVCESTDFWMYTVAHQYEWVWRAKLLIVFFRSFFFACMGDNLLKWAVVFASLLCLFAVKSHLHCN